MASVLSKIVKKQPFLIRKIYYQSIPFNKRYGKKYNQTLALLHQARTWNYDQAKQFQLTKLRKLLVYCDRSVPYYGQLFKKNGFDPNIKSLDDIKQLPILTKKDIIENYNDFISNSFNGKRYKMGTSGTTGQRLTFYGDDNLFKVEAAFVQNAYMSHGTSLYNKHSVWIRRYSPQKGDPIYFKDYELNRSYMSPFHLDDISVFKYVDYINKCKADTLVSYPSTLYYLALLLRKFNLRLPFVKHLHAASEVCLPQWSNIINQVFGVPLKMHYGQVEKVSFAHQVTNDEIYRENLLYGLNEFDSQNNIIGTGFYNYVMPFIRYKTNDIVEFNSDAKLDGAFPNTISRVLGRNGDMLINENNSLIPAVNFYSFMSKYNEIDLFQITQTKRTKKVNFYIVPNDKYSPETREKLMKEMIYRLGKVQINIIEKDSIERDKNSSKLKTVSLV